MLADSRFDMMHLITIPTDIHFGLAESIHSVRHSIIINFLQLSLWHLPTLLIQILIFSTLLWIQFSRMIEPSHKLFCHFLKVFFSTFIFTLFILQHLYRLWLHLDQLCFGGIRLLVLRQTLAVWLFLLNHERISSLFLLSSWFFICLLLFLFP